MTMASKPNSDGLQANSDGPPERRWPPTISYTYWIGLLLVDVATAILVKRLEGAPAGILAGTPNPDETSPKKQFIYIYI